MAEYWEVVYKAIADFGDLMKDAAKAKAELAALNKATKDWGTAQADASAKSAAARQKDIAALHEEKLAYDTLAQAAKSATVWTDFGGRESMPQHLADMQQELSWLQLINRQKWLGFTNPQAAYAWRQLELQQAYLMNRAHFGATSSGTGYTTPDQYLSYLQREYVGQRDLSQVMKDRLPIYTDLGNAYLSYAKALKGESGLTAGGLSEALPGIQAVNNALVGLPDVVTTTLNIDDSAAMAKLATYEALLKGVPQAESTTVTEDQVLKAAYGMGGVPIPSALPPEQIEVSYTGPYQEQFNGIVAEVAKLAAMKADIPVSLEVDPTEVAALQARLGQLNVTELVHEHLAPGGGPLGVGAGPPETVTTTAKFDDADARNVLASWKAELAKIPDVEKTVLAAGGAGGKPPPNWPVVPGAAAPGDEPAKSAQSAAAALGEEGDAAAKTAAQLALLKAAQDQDAESAAKWAYALTTLSAGERSAGDGGRLLVPKLTAAADAAGGAGGAFGFLSRNLVLFGGAFGATAVIGSITGLVLVLHLAIEAILVLVPAIGALIAGLGAIAIWGVAAADAATKVYHQFQALNAVSSAFGQNLPPITDSLHKLEAIARPQVFEALGAALNEASKYGNSFGGIVQKVGGLIDTYLIKVLDWFNGPGKTILSNFVKAGAADLAAFGDLFKNVAKAFAPLIKAGEVTKVAETLLYGLATAVGYVSEALRAVPTWALVLAIAGHSIITYGGLAVTWLQSLGIAVAGVTQNIPGLQRFSTALAASLGASNEQLAKMKGTTPQLEQLAAAIRDGDAAAIGMAKDLGLSTAGLTAVVAKDPEIQQVAKSFGLTAEQVAQTQIALASAGKSAEEWAATSSNATDEVKAGLAGVKAESGGAAANLASLGVIASGSAGKAEEGLAGFAEAAAKGGAATETATKDVGALEKVFSGAGAAAAGLGGFLAGNLVLVLAAAAAGALYLNYAFQQATQSTKTYLADVKSTLAKDTVTQGLTAAASQLGEMTRQINAMGSQVQKTGGVWTQLTANVKSSSDTLTLFTGAWDFLKKSLNLSQESNSIHALTQQQVADLHDVGNVASTSAMLMNHFGLTSAQSIGLMDVAGVHLSDSLTIMQQKVQDLIAGWNMMAIRGGVLYNSVNAVTFGIDQQNSSITQITNGWDAFFKLVSSAPTQFVALQQEIQTVTTDAKAAGASFTGLSATSLTLQGAWLKAATDGQALVDQLMQQVSVGMQGAKGTDLLTQSVKDLVAQLLPGAAQSKTLTAVLAALAQQGGYTGADSFKALSGWVDTGASAMKKAGGPAQDLRKNIQTAAISVGDLATDVKNLDDAVNTALIQAMTNAKLALSPGLTGALEAVGKEIHGVQAVLGGGFNFPPTLLTDASSLARTLDGITGNKQQAERYFETWVISMGLSKAQAQALWTDVQGAGKATDAAGVAAGKLHGMWTPVDQAAAAAGGHADKLTASTGQAAKAAGGLMGVWNQVTSFIAGSWSKTWTGFMRDVGSPFAAFWTKTAPAYFASLGNTIAGGWSKDYESFMRVVGSPFTAFWTKSVPGYFNQVVAFFEGSWKKSWDWFDSNIIQPTGKFWTSTVPGWFGQVSSFFENSWKKSWDWFNANIIQPTGKFWTSTVPGWFDFVLSFFENSWKKSWNWFSANIIQPWGHLFTSTFPGWLNDLVSFFSGSWKKIWADFSNDIMGPMGRWFSSTLPNAIRTGFRDSVNWVIDNVINKVISFIDNDILAHLPGSLHISTIGNVAQGGDVSAAAGYAAGGPFARMSGSVPGASAVDGTRIMAMGGEYMLRQPARMALEAQFGRGFMNWLNQYDQHAGAGSRGTMASQMRRPGVNYASGGPVGFAAGGLHNPIGGGLRPERVDMGVDYGGSGSLYALGSGTITNLWNSGWPGGGFIGLRLSPPYGSGYWYYAEDVIPWGNVHVGSAVTAGQYIAEAVGGPSGIEVGWAAPPGTGQTAADAAGQDKAGLAHGDPGAYPTAWGVAASNLIRSLGGPAGILSGPVQGGTAGLGFLAEIWQSVEGLLDSAGTGLGSLVKPLAGLVSGGAGELLKLARQGAASIFGAVWDHTVKPLVDVMPGDSIPGAISQGAMAQVRQGIVNFMKGQDSNARAQAAAASTAGGLAIGPVNGPADAGPGQAENYALHQLSRYGWGSDQMGPLSQLWMRESGWNRFARNPGSGAYGIPQSLPESKLPPAGQSGGGSHASPQIDWGLNYIKTTPGYGSPAAAWAHELAHNWYAGGGAIGPMDGDPGWDGAMYPFGGTIELAGGGALTDWSPLNTAIHTEMAAMDAIQHARLPSKGPTMAQRHAYTAWQEALWAQQLKTIGLGRTPPGAFGALDANAFHPAKQTSGQWSAFAGDLGYLLKEAEGTGLRGGINPPGTPADSGAVAWKYLRSRWQDLLSSLKTASTRAAAAETQWGTAYSVVPVGPGGTGSTGTDSPEWDSASQAMLTAVRTEMDAMQRMQGKHLPAKGPTMSQRYDYTSWLEALWKQQLKTVGLGHKPPGAFQAIDDRLTTPRTITAGQWNTFLGDLSYLTREEEGPGEGGINPPGSRRNSGYPAWKYERADWHSLLSALRTARTKTLAAEAIWGHLYGPDALPVTPGPRGIAAPAPTYGLVNVMPEATMGGPGSPVFGGTGSPDMGFSLAAGGGLDSVASLFSGGLNRGGVMPVIVPPALSDTVLRRMAGTSAHESREYPRTLSAAGAGHYGPALNVEQLTINNPQPASTPDSIVHATNKLSFLGGRGLA